METFCLPGRSRAVVAQRHVRSPRGDDVRICAKETGDAAIDACSRAIRNARALKIRAQVYDAKGDTARAEADLAAAKQLGE